MSIKKIFDEIGNTAGSNAKMEVLRKYKDNVLLQEVLYHIKSKRVKFFIKQLPDYTPINGMVPASLEWGLNNLTELSSRKLTGNDAINHLTMILESVSAEDAYITERIIDKDPKNGLGTTYITKIIPNLIEKTPYQGAKSYSEKLVRAIFKKYGYAYSDVKMDGRYANAIIQNGDVELESRQGETTHIPADSTLIKELSKFSDGVLNGELTMVEEKEITVKIGETINIDGIEYSPKELYEKYKTIK
jgi:hypothetical protein